MPKIRCVRCTREVWTSWNPPPKTCARCNREIRESKVRDHGDDKSDRLETTNDAKRKK